MAIGLKYRHVIGERYRKHRHHKRSENRLSMEMLEQRYVLTGFTAYNGLFASDQTHENTTFYSPIGEDQSGPLRDIATGELQSAQLSTLHIGAVFDSNGAQPAIGTDANTIFSGYVDFMAGDQRSIELGPDAAYQYSFENLDSGATYQFAGTAVRGNPGYTDRWTLVELHGAESFTAAHSDGDGVITDGLAPNEVALWVGDNSAADQGWVAQWLDIDPGADGIVRVSITQYTGEVATSIDPDGVADASKSYGLAGIRFIENAPEGPPVVQTSAPMSVLAFEAEVAGEVTSTGGSIPDVAIYYGTSDGGTNPLAWDGVVSSGQQSSAFSAILDGLQQNTTYFYRAFAGNALGTSWASTTQTFKTLSASPPTIENQDPESIGAFSVVIRGEVVETGNDLPIATVYYGPTDGGQNPNAWANSIDVGEQNGQFSVAINDLVPLSNYYYTTFAQNGLGSDWASPSIMFTTTETPPLQINEILTDNDSVLTTRVRQNANVTFVGDNLTPDFIEIANPTGSIAGIGGYYLTDDLNELKKWQFPAGTVIPPRGFLVVYASGLNVSDPSLDETGRLHTNFQLGGAGGEELAIVNAEGEIVFAFDSIPVQSEDISYGLNEVGEARYYGVPTPGESNANNTPKAPTFSVDNRTFVENFVVEIAADLPTHEIRYTTNETRPTASSTLYTGPITIDSSTNLRAIAVAPDGSISTIASRSYVELGSAVVNDTSNLPIVVVNTFGDSVPGVGSNFGDGAFIGIIEPGEDGTTRLTDDFTVTTRGGLHVRGSSSSGFAKKQYRVEFWDEQNEDLKLPVLGMPKEADWIFYGPGQFDRALISNPLMFDLSNQMGRYATRTRWVEMYLNTSGDVGSRDYIGVYAITEVIEEGEDRVNVGELSSGAGGQPVEGGFIWKNDRGNAYVDPDPTTSRQRSYINQFITGLTRAADNTDPETGYEAWADVPSFIDHNILNLFSMNVDALRLSSFYHKSADSKLTAGPIWDFDRSLDSTDGRDNNPQAWYGSGDSTRYFNDGSRVRQWWPDMFKDPDFVQQYIDRWFDLRQGVLNYDNIVSTIDKHADEIEEAAARDYSRWSIGGRFSTNVSRMKSWIRTRLRWIDDQWLSQPEYSVDNPQVPAGSTVNLTSSTGDVYYTLDGSDPRGESGAIRPEAIKATGPIAINGITTITARVYKQGYRPEDGEPGYARTGDDWSAPITKTYFNDPPATAGVLAITEVHYNPADPSSAEESLGFDNNDDFEFVELTNIGPVAIVLAGASLSQVDVDGETEGIAFEFSSGTIQKLAPGQRVLVVENVAAFEARYGTGLPVAGQWSGSLSNNNELLTVTAFDGTTIHQFRYNDGGSWPALADGFGSSIELIGNASDASDSSAWAHSIAFGGTPGSSRIEPIGVVVNEVLSHTDLPQVDSIELYNTTNTAIDISGWFLSDSASNLLKYKIPAGTVIQPNGYAVSVETQFNPTPADPSDNHFALSSSRGDQVWVTVADSQGLLPKLLVDNVDFPATLNGESMGRYPNGSGELYPLQSNTFGSQNSMPRVGPVIFSEIHYSPAEPSLDATVLYPAIVRDDLEYVEIHNPTPAAIDLTNWRIRGGVDYNFDDGTILPANGTLLVISFEPNKPDNTDRFIAFRRHHNLNANVAVVGGYSGQLSDNGESLRLLSPDDPPAEDPTLIPRIWEDVVVYSTGGSWPVASNNGRSLSRVSASAFGGDSSGWIASERNPGAYGSIDADFNGDGTVDVSDIDVVCSGIHSGNLTYDFDGDGSLNDSDVDFMVGSIFFTTFGDSNYDGTFNSTDLIRVFAANEYEDNMRENSLWSEGDWNCDGDFDSGDLVRAFKAGGYSAAATSMNHAVSTDRTVISTIASNIAAAAMQDDELMTGNEPVAVEVTAEQSEHVRTEELALIQIDAVFAKFRKSGVEQAVGDDEDTIL
ncbi:MAG: lamin tail domain-containing protein [Planctomycetales bacterium]|nr:lamin tail domain-containing protein [Planctomycetales bacterium]